VVLLSPVPGHNYWQFSRCGVGEPSTSTQLQVQGRSYQQFCGSVLVSPVPGRNYQQFSGSGFGEPSASTQLPVQGCNFRGVVSRGPCQASDLGKPVARTQLFVISWQWFW